MEIKILSKEDVNQLQELNRLFAEAFDDDENYQNFPPSDSYLNNNKYLSYLVDKISTGEVDPEILTVAEQDCVANFIRNPKA